MSEYRFINNAQLLADVKLGEQAALDRLVSENMGLVKSIAQRFRERGVEYDDLIQIGTIGMIKAAKSFDPSYNTVFSTYAVPMIIGEIKRFLRDDSAMKVSRDIKKLGASILRQKELFTAQHGREPHTGELCELTGVSAEQLVYALDAVSPIRSLQETVSGGHDDEAALEEFIADSDDQIDRTTTNLALSQALRALPREQRDLIRLRYFRGLSQQQTAKLLGLTQVKVSREEKKIFEQLRKIL